MKLIQELYSKTGMLRTKELLVTHLKKENNVLLSYTKYTDIIRVNKEYPMIFRNQKLRDAAFDNIEAAFNQQKDYTIALDDFYSNILQSDQLVDILKGKNFTIEKHLFECVQQLMKDNNCSFEQLKNKDAFIQLSTKQFKNIQKKAHQKFNNYETTTFSKSLRYPKQFHSVCTPSCFWNSINEL